MLTALEGTVGPVPRVLLRDTETGFETPVVKPDPGGMTLLREASDAMRLSARGYHRILRVARTLADLDGDDAVRRVHLAEALAYRALTDDLRRAA